MHLLFLYGTLKKGEPNHNLITDPSNGYGQYLGNGETVDIYPLVIASKYNIPYLLKRIGLGHHVRGEVYRVDDSMLAVLDELESHPTYYKREKIVIRWLDTDQTHESERLQCWAYFLTDYKPFMLQLPHLENYNSKGPHNLPYVSRYTRVGPDPHEHVKETQYQN